MKVMYRAGLAVLFVFGLLAAPASAQPCRTTVLIDASGNIHDPAPMKCQADETVTWEVDNKFSHDLKVSFTDFEVKSTKTPGNPLKIKNPSVSPKKGSKKSSSGVRVKAKGAFGGSLPFTLYKYTIRAHDLESKRDLTPIDPELDVTPPNEVGPRGRGRGRGGRP